MDRYLKSHIIKDLEKKMVFIGGPRQVGKTTLSLEILSGNETHPAYFSWDDRQDRISLLAHELPTKEKLIVLDEIHKYPDWRQMVKGFYDKNKSSKQFLITGSARLDYYRHGGDSLQGRYFYYRLHPLSFMEILSYRSDEDDQMIIDRLLKFGGFPEPYFAANEKDWLRWQNSRLSRLTHEDLADLEKVREIAMLDLLVDDLRRRAASSLSVHAISQDLKVSHETTERWIQILENLYYCYRISPFGSPKIKALKKEQKLYLWDWSQVLSEGGKWENFIASNLLKFCHYNEDVLGERMELRYLKDKDQREIDFVVCKNDRPIFAVECKSSAQTLSPNIKYFSERTDIPFFYQVHKSKKDFEHISLRARSLPFITFAKEVLKI